ncbi:carboxyl transferase domain-containing protein [Pseudonocardia sp. NPDC049154]|uniref:ATP-binding protein n=1 Tax=Pseudonocardia sp. NPDC049154 TaxID=3155501 RepID=UPI0033CAA1D0
MPPPRVAVLNRGEPAVRFLQTAADLVGTPEEVRTIAFTTAAESGSLFARRADEVVDLEAFPPSDPALTDPYLDQDRLLAALRAARADLVWVGWGFLSENADFAQRCADEGFTFVGPRPETMRLLADKIGAKRLAERVGVPVAAWSGGPVATVEEAVASGERIGFPLLVKAAAGGGGMGIRVVESATELPEAFRQARAEGRRVFGDGTVFLESRVDGGRHVEVQVLADDDGTVWPIGVRDCSAQRRRQKVLEETGPVPVDAALDARLRRYAVELCAAAGYRNAGTVEFLVEPDGRVHFMEVNARLQVEHPVTELTTGTDLVRAQLRIALGEPLRGAPPVPFGHAIEVRLTAEDVPAGFVPAPGRIARLVPPQGPGVRMDTAVEEGDVVASSFDSMIGKILAWGPDRATALTRLRRAVRQTEILVEGGATNRHFLQALLDLPDVESGDLHVGWLDERLAAADLAPPPGGEVAVLQAAVSLFERSRDAGARRFAESLRRAALEVPDEPFAVGLEYRGIGYDVEVSELAPDRYRVAVEGRPALDVRVGAPQGGHRTLQVEGVRSRTVVVPDGDGVAVSVDGVAHRVTRADAGGVRSPLPGLVVSVLVRPGDEVVEGQALAVLECMKLETTVVAPAGGTVAEVVVGPQATVRQGEVLLRLGGPEAPERASGALAFPAAGAAASALDLLEALVLGAAVDPSVDGLSTAALPGVLAAAAGDPERERRLVETLCDVWSFAVGDPSASSGGVMEFARRWAEDGRRPDGATGAAFETVRGHLRTAAGDPDDLVVLAHTHRALCRAPVIAPAVAALLRRRLRAAPDRTVDRASDRPALGRTLDRLIAVAEGPAPELCDVARSVRFWLVTHPAETREQQVVAQARAVRVAAPAERAELASHPTASATWESWLPCAVRAGLDPRSALVAMVAALHPDRAPEVATAAAAAGPIVLAGVAGGIGGGAKPVTVVAVGGDADSADVRRAVDAAGTEPVVVQVLHVAGGTDRTAEPLANLGAGADRVVVTTLPASEDAAVEHETFDAAPDGSWVPCDLAGLHPVRAAALELWRLREFTLTRVPHPGPEVLLDGTATAEPRDRRLFALAEVHSLEVVRGVDGRVEALPELELALAACLDAIRHHPGPGRGARSGWHRVTVTVRPEWELPLDALHTVAARIAHATRGLSLDQIVVRLHDVGGDDRVVHMVVPPTTGIQIGEKAPSDRPVSALAGWRRAEAELRRRGLHHPWQIIRLLTSPGASRSDLPAGTFTELDLVDGELQEVDREPGANTAGVVVGLLSNNTSLHPEGMRRVALLSDPSRGMGSLGEAECTRILAAIALAEETGLPLEWFSVSSGARVSMDSGTENLDWTAAVLRALVEATQRGLTVNVVVSGVNVGAQSYWAAEATMLMHTRGTLIMVGDSSLVLTGKDALQHSGAVSAESNTAIGGFVGTMGPNGEAQHWAADMEQACLLLLRHLGFTYVVPGETGPRVLVVTDPADRSVVAAPHTDPQVANGFATVGEVFDPRGNPERKKPFDIRSVMSAVCDADVEPLERWARMRDAENAVVWDARLGGHSVALVGIESRDLPRTGRPPSDGPGRWTAGTLFPLSSKKVARAISSASGSRPVVVLASLSGFDGSPESMRDLQLEYGAEIGRAVVDFRGPIVFCVLSRYHGGAFVVFSKRLNDRLEVIALEGARASVLGGGPAAAVVFAREVERRVNADPRVQKARRSVESAEAAEAVHGRDVVADVVDEVRGEIRSQVAAEFDAVHTVERARAVGSLDAVVPVAELRPRLVDAVTRGLAHSH